MFFQPPDEEHAKKITNHPHNRRKRHARKNKQKAAKKGVLKKKQSRFSITMSAWAENFTKAATWQLEHKIAYWKSKARALEYENRILHDIIRKNYLNDNCDASDEPEMFKEIEENADEIVSEEEEEEEEFEVSEEYVSFLTANAKFKEEARLERERLKALHNSDGNFIKEMEAGPSGEKGDKQETLKELYGDNWQRISALETSLHSEFIDVCDREKPMHWPNIPLNFEFS